ncbi:MAG: site-2 protease family protein [Clostridia bacterium]|nr:site-2 protease family protein [Clostridia bacterium]
MNKASLSDIIIYLASSFIVIFLTMPIHEWAHGFVSTKLGDPTPRWQGRLTLNPIAHIDWMGAAGILLFGIGWAKPVQVNARYYKNPKWGMAIVALAGPLSNIIVAFISYFLYGIICTVFIKTGIIYENYSFLMVLASFFGTVAQINVYLAVFNLIPIPPFDGSRILFTFLPQKYYFKIMQYERYIFIGVLIIIYTGILDLPLSILSSNILNFVADLAFLPFSLFGV